MNKTSRKNPQQNPRSHLKEKLASRFLGALNNMAKSTTTSPSMAEKGRRHRAIRAAAYASMASAVGPRKAWSRALLKKIIHGKKRMVLRRRRRNPRNGAHGTMIGLNELSEMVPGGEAMDSCRLLNETGHYIKCLRAQVEIMRQILDYSSSRIS